MTYDEDELTCEVCNEPLPEDEAHPNSDPPMHHECYMEWGANLPSWRNP